MENFDAEYWTGMKTGSHSSIPKQQKFKKPTIGKRTSDPFHLK
jgi:hypothetical protein